MEQILTLNDNAISLLQQYQRVRKHSEAICKPLEIEDYVVQPIPDVSPPCWSQGSTYRQG